VRRGEAQAEGRARRRSVAGGRRRREMVATGAMNGGGLLLELPSVLPSVLTRCPPRQVHVQTQAGRVFTFQVRCLLSLLGGQTSRQCSPVVPFMWLRRWL